MDFIIGLLKVQGRDYVFMPVDKLTKFTHFMAISSDYIVAYVEETFLWEIFRLHKVPKHIVSD